MTTDTIDLNKVRQLKALKKALFGKFELSHKDAIVKGCQWAHREHLVSIRPVTKTTCEVSLTGAAKDLIEQYGHLVP